MRYALTKTSDNSVIRFQDFDEVPPVLAEAKGLVWVVDELTNTAAVIESLEDLKARKNQEINDARLHANQTTFTYSGKAIACDQLSRGYIDAVNGIVAITNELPPSWIGGWKAVDNTIVPIPNLNTWISFYAAMVQQGTINFNKAQTLKLQLETAYSAGNRENMEGITW